MTQNNLTITMPHQVYMKLKYYAQEADGEISGLGSVDKFENNLLIEDIYLFKQTCSGAHTELDKKDVALFLQRKDIDSSKIKLWWHSHNNFQTFWSGVDDDNINEFIHSDWIVSIVINKSTDILARIDVFDPIRITFDNIPIEILDEDEDLRTKIVEEIKDKVSPEIIVLPPVSDSKTDWEKNREEALKKILDEQNYID